MGLGLVRRDGGSHLIALGDEGGKLAFKIEFLARAENDFSASVGELASRPAEWGA